MASFSLSFLRFHLKDAADYAAFGADRAAVDGNGLRAGHENDDCRDFVGSFKALQERCGPRGREELLFDFRRRYILLLSHIFQECGGAFRGGGTGENGIDGDAGACDGFSNTTGDSYLRGLGHAVVNHLSGNVLSGFAGDENNPTPILFKHCGKISAGEAHTAQHVDLEKAQPFRVGNFQERLYIEDTQIVNENVRGGNLAEKILDARRIRSVVYRRLKTPRSSDPAPQYDQRAAADVDLFFERV